MIEVEVSKAVIEDIVTAIPIKSGLNELTLEQAMDLEHVAWLNYKSLGKTPLGRSYASLSRNLATAVEATRSIQQVEREVATVLDGKWDDEDAVETHIQLMVHRGWDRSYAMQVIDRVRP